MGTAGVDDKIVTACTTRNYCVDVEHVRAVVSPGHSPPHSVDSSHFADLDMRPCVHCTILATYIPSQCYIRGLVDICCRLMYVRGVAPECSASARHLR